jgi:predicted amidohydrolase YtcJ
MINMLEADLILHNAKVLTLDPDHPLAELVIIQNGKVLCVSQDGEFTSFKGRKTTVIDCNRRTVLPGFHDAHCHPLGLAKSLISIDLSNRDIRSISDIQNRIKEVARNCQPGNWIRASGYNEFYLVEKRHPNRRDLDQATTDHPVILTHQSGHAHVLNSIALAISCISMDTSEPPGGMIERDLETGEPNGILYDMNTYLAQVISPMDDSDLERSVKLASNALVSQGITSVQDASVRNNLDQWQMYQRYKSGEIFTPRVSMMLGIEAFSQLRDQEFSPGTGNADLSLGAIKIIVDETKGKLNPSQDELNNHVLEIHRAGFQVAIHALEESTIEAACAAFEYALHCYPRPSHRHRIEHCSICTPYTANRLAALDIMVVTQPAFLYYNGERYLNTIPAEQLNHLYPISRLISSGLKVAASSDCPVIPPNPLHGIYAAVARTTMNGQRVLPDEGIAPTEAVSLYTLGAAYSSFKEGCRGSISQGKLADLVILNENPMEVSPEDLKKLEVEMTIINGEIVWRKNL